MAADAAVERIGSSAACSSVGATHAFDLISDFTDLPEPKHGGRNP